MHKIGYCEYRGLIKKSNSFVKLDHQFYHTNYLPTIIACLVSIHFIFVDCKMKHKCNDGIIKNHKGYQIHSCPFLNLNDVLILQRL